MLPTKKKTKKVIAAMLMPGSVRTAVSINKLNKLLPKTPSAIPKMPTRTPTKAPRKIAVIICDRFCCASVE